MDITEVRITLMGEDKLKAYVSVTFDGCFVVRDLKVIQGTNGMFVAMPSKKMRDGSFRDIAHPLNNDFRAQLESRVLEEYRQEAGEPEESEGFSSQGDSVSESDLVEESVSVADSGES